MRILIAPDKFKGCLGAREVGEYIAAGLRETFPAAEIDVLPIADGGEGTAEIICAARGGEWVAARVHDSLGRFSNARFAWIADKRWAVLDVADVVGLSALAAHERNPTATTSFGLGELLLAAQRHGAVNVLIGLGGSATNDGGLGMARALGVKFFDQEGARLTEVVDLARLHRVEEYSGERGLGVFGEMVAAVDVNNPLLGPHGATRMFAAQKGADRQQSELLESALTQLADVVAKDLRRDSRELPGAGAAGGLGFGLASFCGATLRSGFDVVAEQIGLESAVRRADVVITGEGRLDPQSLRGKAPVGLARLARRFQKKCYAIVGALENAAELCELFESIVVLSSPGDSLEQLVRNTPLLLQKRASEIGARLRQLAE